MALAGSVVARDARKFALVATDLDGTLLNSKHALSPTSKRVLRRLHERGVQVVLCSGRMLFAMEPYERELDIDMPMVCYNGSVVVGRKAVERPVLFSRPLPKHVVNAVIEFAERSKTLLQLYPADHQLYLSCANDEHRAHAERYRQLTGCTLVHVESYARFRDTQPFKMLLLTWPKPHEVEALREALTRAVPEIRTEAHIVSGQFFVEVLHPRANKEIALRELCKQLDIGMEHVVAFGDGDNDKEMLGSVGLGVAVKNAVPQAKRRAAHVSPLTNDEDAVARELEHLLEAGAFQPLARAQQETRRRRVASRL